MIAVKKGITCGLQEFVRQHGGCGTHKTSNQGERQETYQRVMTVVPVTQEPIVLRGCRARGVECCLS